MNDQDNVLFEIQRDRLIPAFKRMLEIAQQKGVPATVASTDDSRTISFNGKDGAECWLKCSIIPASRPLIKTDIRKPEGIVGLELADKRGLFADEVSPDFLAEQFLRIFRSCL